MHRRLMITATIALTLILAASSARGDWTRFRGPNGSGISSSNEVTPTTWSESENLRWKVPLPGPGSSSPIVVGDRVFVTCWSGYGTDANDPGDQKELKRHLLCIDANTGNTVWSKAVEPYLPEDEFRGMFTQHGYASHTPVSDGEQVYVFFGKTGALAFDMEGNRLWQTSVGTESGARGWG
jgi:outer membrane protein assembly factor BamB